jgi:hypothetical protein
MRPWSALAAATAVVGCALALAPAASAAVQDPIQDPIPIGPNQSFQGNINGLHSGATIYVVCPGPIWPGRLGHPVSGQPVKTVLNSSTAAGGYTGSLGRSIVASFGPATTSTPQTLTFTSHYAPQDIPTTFLLPCDGTALVPFAPRPTSPTAVTDHVKVTFVNIAV